MNTPLHVNSHSFNSHQRVQGFTLIELVVVVLLLGLLAAAALPRMLDITGDARVAALEGVAGGFATAVVIEHAQWMAEGNSRGGPTTPSDKVAVNLDGKIVYNNEFGWPANTDPGSDAGADNQTASECQEIFSSILQNAPSSTTNDNELNNVRYIVSVLDQAGGDDIGNSGDVCRYELIISDNDPGSHYFDYDLVDGQVTPITPN